MLTRSNVVMVAEPSRLRKRRRPVSLLKYSVAVMALITIGVAVAAAQPVFVGSGSLNTARYGHAAVLLQDGRVLVVGGWGVINGGYFTALISSELYDPESETWMPTGDLQQARVGAQIVRLPSGKVLVVGGYGPTEQGGYRALPSAELYDPVSGSFTLTGDMSASRSSMTATLLDNGTVLVAGGSDESFSYLTSAETYDPDTGEFSSTTSMPYALSNHAAALLPGGEVLLVGGCSSFGCLRTESLRYDPQQRTFLAASPMMMARSNATATRLADGRILVAGGFDASGELYDAATGAFSLAGAMAEFRLEHTATSLPSGHVLYAGGNGPLAGAELYLGDSGFDATTPMRQARAAHTATALTDGRVLIAGGVGNFYPLQTSELYYETGFIDIVPPQITVPEDITVAAFQPTGAYVTYTVGATDNVDVSPAVSCAPASSTLFAVGETVVQCSAADTAGNTGTANFKVTVLAPLELSVTIGNSVVDAVTGQVTVRGTVTCNRQATGSVYGNLQQVIASRAVVTAVFANAVECSGTGASHWSATADATPSRFRPGKADVSAFVSACDSYTCDSEVVDATVNLTAKR